MNSINPQGPRAVYPLAPTPQAINPQTTSAVAKIPNTNDKTCHARQARIDMETEYTGWICCWASTSLTASQCGWKGIFSRGCHLDILTDENMLSRMNAWGSGPRGEEEEEDMGELHSN
jgi:hypothetical protein